MVFTMAILIAQRKTKVDYFDAESQLNNCINNYVEIILSSDQALIENQEVQEPEEDKKPEQILEKHCLLKQGITTTTTSAKEQNMNTPSKTLSKKRKKDDIKTPSSKSLNSKKRKTTTDSTGVGNKSPTPPTLRSPSNQKDGALTTPTTPNV
jgi:hypothetical protein